MGRIVMGIDALASLPVFVIPAVFVRVKDGDTLIARLDLLPKGDVQATRTLRFAGFNAEECDSRDPIKRAKGDAAKKYLDYLLNEGEELVVTTKASDLYGRILCTIVRKRDGMDVIKVMQEKGHLTSVALYAQVNNFDKRCSK